MHSTPHAFARSECDALFLRKRTGMLKYITPNILSFAGAASSGAAPVASQGDGGMVLGNGVKVASFFLFLGVAKSRCFTLHHLSVFLFFCYFLEFLWNSELNLKVNELHVI